LSKTQSQLTAQSEKNSYLENEYVKKEIELEAAHDIITQLQNEIQNISKTSANANSSEMAKLVQEKNNVEGIARKYEQDYRVLENEYGKLKTEFGKLKNSFEGMQRELETVTMEKDVLVSELREMGAAGTSGNTAGGVNF